PPLGVPVWHLQGRCPPRPGSRSPRQVPLPDRRGTTRTLPETGGRRGGSTHNRTAAVCVARSLSWSTSSDSTGLPPSAEVSRLLPRGEADPATAATLPQSLLSSWPTPWCMTPTPV